MIAWSIESFVDVLAGCSLLVFAMRAYQRIEPVTMSFFAAVWGLHFILAQTEPGTAVAQVLLPLQAMFLFLFTDYVAPYQFQHEVAHGLAWVTGSCAVVVAGLLLLGVPLVEPWSIFFVQGPYHLGVTLCLLLLAWDLPSKQDSRAHWQILVGLAIPFSYSSAALFFQETQSSSSPDFLESLVTAVPLLTLALVVSNRLHYNARRGEAGERRRHKALASLIPLTWLVALWTHPFPIASGLVALAATWSLLWPPVRFQKPKPLDMENWIPNL